MIGEWPDMQRECASDWLTCSSGDIELSCSLLVHVPSTESCYRHIVSAKYYYNTFVDVSPLLFLMFMTLFKNIQWNSRTFQYTRTQNSRTFRRPVATWPRQSPITPTAATAHVTRRQLAKSPLQNNSQHQSNCLNWCNSIHGDLYYRNDTLQNSLTGSAEIPRLHWLM